MPPLLALVLTLVFIAILFMKESLHEHKTSIALWIPCLWLLILGSRPVSSWLDYYGGGYSADDLMEGSPIDRVVFFSLMAAGLVTLLRRPISWSQVFLNNKWLILYFLYCGISVLWSDFALVSAKRWFKALGDPMMVLIVLSEPEPLKALETVVRRCAFLLIPFSILLIKYYPHLGKGYDDWTGANFYVGITTNKNTLGLLCYAFFLFYYGRFCYLRMQQQSAIRRTDLVVLAVLFFMFGWCFNIVDSKTPLLSFLLAASIYTALGYQHVRKYFGTYTVVIGALFTVLQLGFNIKDAIVVSVGRDPTLTGRTELWDVVLGMHTEPLLGYGFESFWLGDRLKKLWDMYYFKPNMAHNGYIEIFLNLGLVGLGLFVGMLLSCYHKTKKRLQAVDGPGAGERLDMDRFRMALLVSFCIFNVTEGGFRSLNFIFVFFLLFSMSYSRTKQEVLQTSQVGDPRNVQRMPA